MVFIKPAENGRSCFLGLRINFLFIHHHDVIGRDNNLKRQELILPSQSKIFIGLGANLTSDYGAPQATLGAALDALVRDGVEVAACSDWYRTAPVPISDQPWYVNGVAEVKTDLSPKALLDKLLSLETGFGRIRTVANAPRVCDLDLLDYRGDVSQGTGDGPDIPHPRLHERAFVLLPLRDIAPDWHHPVLQKNINDLIKMLPADQEIEKMVTASGLFGTEWTEK